jgi:hypothetical protein
MTTLLERINDAVVEDRRADCSGAVATSSPMQRCTSWRWSTSFEGNWGFLAHESQISDGRSSRHNLCSRRPNVAWAGSTAALQRLQESAGSRSLHELGR